ncbi:MAG: nucleotidyltransferase domain-containing protein [Candidatus Hermodarchaeota archaeon]
MFDPLPPIEGFFVESKEGLIFDVKGIIHPPQFITAFVRYIPSNLLPLSGLKLRNSSLRNMGSQTYLKVYDLNDRYKILSKYFPTYLKFNKSIGLLVQGVPFTKLKTIYDPRLYFIRYKNQYDLLQTTAKKLVKALESLGIREIGVTGSLLVNLHTSDSDLDLVVYGLQNCLKTWHAMNDLFELDFLERYNSQSIQNLYRFRVKDTMMSLEDFIKIELKKKLQGMLFLENDQKIDFYIRLVKYPTEYPSSIQKIVAREEVTISATISDSKEAIFTPCRYLLKNVQFIEYQTTTPPIPSEIMSYRGRFCECAFKNDIIEAKGTLEYTSDNKTKLILGSQKDHYLKIIH